MNKRKPNFIANNPVGVQDEFDGKHQPTNINKNACNGILQEKLDGLLADAARQNDYSKRVAILQEVLVITRIMTNELKKLSWYFYQYEGAVKTLENMGCIVNEKIAVHDLQKQETEDYGVGVDLVKSVKKLANKG